MTASLAPIPSVTVEAGAGYQVPLNGHANGNTDPQTYSVTTNNPTGGATATVASGEFWSITVSHASSGPGDPAFSGTMVFQLFQDLTPNSTAMIESLINGTVPFANLTAQAQPVIYPNGSSAPGVDYYTATNGGDTFHRVSSGFPGPNDYIVQGGSLNGDGTGQVFATPYANETSAQLVFNGTGQLALANSGGTDSDDSQFFVTTGSPRSLDGNYTIFGQLVSGADILADMTQVTGTPLSGGLGTSPTDKIVITGSSLSTTSPDGVIHINAASSTAGTQTNVTVTATDSVDGSTVSRTFPVLTIPSATGNEPTTTAPRLNTVPTPITTNIFKPVSFQLSAYNPTGGQLSYTVQGGLSNGAFTPVANGTATVSSTGLVTVTPTPGYTGPISLVVGVEDQTNRAGSSATLASPANYSLQNVTVEVAQPVVTGAVRFILDSSGGTTGNLVVTPLPRPSPTARNTIAVSQDAGSIMITVNGVVDSIQPAVTDVDSIDVYGSKANDRITIDPSLTMPVELNGGTGGHDVLTAGGGPTREQGWNAKSTVEKQGEAENFLFGKARTVTFVKGSGTSNVIFVGTPFHPRGHSRIRRIPPLPRGTYFTFVGDKLVKTSDPFTTKPASTAKASSTTKK